MHRTLTRSLAGGLALTLLFAACSDDGGDDEADSTTTEAEESTTTAAEETTTTAAEDEGSTTTEGSEPGGDEGEGDPDAVALAEAINLTIDDFAPGWEAEPSSDEDSEGSINDCFVETPIREAAAGRAESDTFSIEVDADQGQLVTMQTVVFDSPETAEAITAEAQGDAFATCATDGLVGSLGDGAEGRLALQVDDPALTEESFALAGAVAIPSEGGAAAQGLVDVHVFRTQGVVSFVATIDIGETGQFEDTITGIYATVAQRHAENVQ